MVEKIYLLGFALMIICATMMDSSNLAIPVIIGFCGVVCVLVAGGYENGEM